MRTLIAFLFCFCVCSTSSAQTGTCTPKRILTTVTAPARDAQFRSGEPVMIEVRLLDDCGRAIDARGGAGVKISSISTGQPTVTLVNTSNGRWSATVVFNVPGPTLVRMNITAFTILLPNLNVLADQIRFEI